MGLFAKSLVVVLAALAIPLAYRQLVDQQTVGYLSSKVSNYKAIDQFLRQSANSIDSTAKQYLNKETAARIHAAIETNVRPHVETLLKTSADYAEQLKQIVQQKAREFSQSFPPSPNAQQPKQSASTQRPARHAQTQTPAKPSGSLKTGAKPHVASPATAAPAQQKQQEAEVRDEPKVKRQAELSKARFVTCPSDKSSAPGDAPTKLWSKNELAEFKDGEQILLAFMGIVYNVSSARDTYYGPGKDYSMFAGRDATRAYLTGNFTHDLTDDIADMDASALGDLNHWSSFYQQSYAPAGRLEGPYYDSQGCPTAETKRIHKALENLAQESEKREQLSVVLPECNSEWNGDTKKSRVWCSKASGGIERTWAGVPRIYKDEASGSDRCVCFSDESKVDAQLATRLRPYPNCKPESFECNL